MFELEMQRVMIGLKGKCVTQMNSSGLDLLWIGFVFSISYAKRRNTRQFANDKF